MLNFENRHVGPTSASRNEMLKVIGEPSVDSLINKTIPEAIRMQAPLNIGEGYSEAAYLEHIKALSKKNKVFKSYIGQGYNETIIPSVIQRNVLENPGWYTAYTPYQAEISQGRLEALLNFQTMIMDLTQMELANASLLDEGTAAAEAMIMFYNLRKKKEIKAGKNKFFISRNCFAQTIEVVEGRAKNLGIDLVIEDPEEFELDETFFGAIIQYPDRYGRVKNLDTIISGYQEHEVKVAVAADVMSLVLLEGPGKWGADVVFGSTQRFGVPMGYGGPHAAYFATKEAYKRNLPGRIIGVSKDRSGQNALRMALQTREQHIKRDKATSNICTAQALLAVMAGMYAVYHGPDGLKGIATEIIQQARYIADEAEKLGYEIVYDSYFDTILLRVPNDVTIQNIKTITENHEINLFYPDNQTFSISVGEPTNEGDIEKLLQALAKVVDKEWEEDEIVWHSYDLGLDAEVLRKDQILQHPIFNIHHSETQMMRYLKRLENKDLSLVHSMISLGSCTMKLNAATELMPITWPEFAHMHPFAPKEQVKGYLEIIQTLSLDLCEITGFDGMSLQPNSGAQGEYAGLAVIKAYHENRGEGHRNKVLIPTSAHGTNPASAVMAGMEVVLVNCDENGNIDVDHLTKLAEEHKDELSALMVTYPSTHGVFEEKIIDITQIIHENGGQVYMDGANMNAQVGLTNPGLIGADVCHLNLHKTFAIPHGGGGPGMGPIGVAKHLKPFLPSNPHIQTGGSQAIPAISSAPYGSALILLISYGYIKMLGGEGLKSSTENAILNANYLKAILQDHFQVLYQGKNKTVAHEMIIDCRHFKKDANVEVADIAKRLIDYGFHAPTVSFPVAGTLMIEPTESEDKGELDRFCSALISIRKEIEDIQKGDLDQENNMLKNAPHTASQVTADNWDYPYSRQTAAYPIDYLQDFKYWVPVQRIDEAYGDRNLICDCPPIEAYELAN